MGDSDRFWQRVDYENVQSYCTHFWHVGHVESVCHVNNPILKESGKGPKRPPINPPAKHKQVHVLKPRLEDHHGMNVPHVLPTFVAADPAPPLELSSPPSNFLLFPKVLPSHPA